jgi:dipeptidase D
MKDNIRDFYPPVLWGYFDDICQVPRPSKKEEKIIQFLMDFGKKHQLETLQDETGNILIRKFPVNTRSPTITTTISKP